MFVLFESFFITSHAGAVAKYCDEYVCPCVCLPVCPRVYLRSHTRDLYHFCACCLCPWLGFLWHVDDRPHRLSAVRWEGGDGSAQRRRSVIYDCLVNNCLFWTLYVITTLWRWKWNHSYLMLYLTDLMAMVRAGKKRTHGCSEIVNCY